MLQSSKILYKEKQRRVGQVQVALPSLPGTDPVLANSNIIPFCPQKDLSSDDTFCGLPSYDIQAGSDFTFLHFPLRFNYN